ARIIGFDINPGAVTDARAALQEAFRHYMGAGILPETVHVYQADPLCYPDLMHLLRTTGASAPRQNDRLLVVGNPPYVEAKRLPREMKVVLKSRYPDAVVGAPDLYLYFLHACLGWLRDGDRLAFVLPNKLLVNANAQSIRERLLEARYLRALWFATQAQVFSDASVYPVVLFAGRA